MSPVTASPRSWTAHISITFAMSVSGNSSFIRYAIRTSRQLCSATLSCRSDEVQEWRVLHFNFSACARKSSKVLSSIVVLLPISFFSALSIIAFLPEKSHPFPPIPCNVKIRPSAFPYTDTERAAAYRKNNSSSVRFQLV